MIITVKLTPKARRNEIKGWAESADGGKVLKASVTAAPEKGKANEALIELLAAHYKTSKSRIEIIRGETERMKIVRIDD